MDDNMALQAISQALLLDVRGESKRAYASDARIFQNWLQAQGVTDVRQITPVMVMGYRAYLLDTSNKKATALRRFVVARRLLEIATDTLHLLDSNPAKQVKTKIKVNDSASHAALLRSEARRLIEAVDTSTPAGKRDKAILALLLYTGIRRAECAAIKIGDIEAKHGHRVLIVQHGKGDKRREVPLRPEVFRALADYLDAVGRTNVSPDALLFTSFYNPGKIRAAGITARQIANIVQKYAELAGVQATPHALRATAITEMIDAGVPTIRVQHLVGHESPDTTERYYTRKADLDNSPVYKLDYSRPD